MKIFRLVLLSLMWLIVETFADLEYKQRLAAIKGSRDCNHLLKEENDTITSPGYPFFYPSNVKCKWVIEAKEGWQILAHLTDLRVEPSKYCEFDSVNVYDGKDEESPLIRNFCGEAPPEYLRSSGRFMTVVMKTDQSESLQGFKIEYRAVPGCEHKLTTSSGYIESPNYPEKYTSNLHCKYSIEASGGKSIELTFIDFELEELTYGECFDYLSVQKISRDQSEQIGRFCGSEIKKKICINTSNLLLQFVTDQALNFKGFKVGYSINDEKCTNEKEAKGEDLSQTLMGQSGLKGDPGLQSELIEMEAKLKELMKLKTLKGLLLSDKGFSGKGKPIEDQMKGKLLVIIKSHGAQFTESTRSPPKTNLKNSAKSFSLGHYSSQSAQSESSTWVNPRLRNETIISHHSSKRAPSNFIQPSATRIVISNVSKTSITSSSQHKSLLSSSSPKISVFENVGQVAKLSRSSKHHKSLNTATLLLTPLSNKATFLVKSIDKHPSSSYSEESSLSLKTKMQETSTVTKMSSVLSAMGVKPTTSLSRTPLRKRMTSMTSAMTSAMTPPSSLNKQRKTRVRSSTFDKEATQNFTLTTLSNIISSNNYKRTVIVQSLILKSSSDVTERPQVLKTKSNFDTFGTKSFLTNSKEIRGSSLQIFKNGKNKDLSTRTQDYPTEIKVSSSSSLSLNSSLPSFGQAEHFLLSDKLSTSIKDDKSLNSRENISMSTFLQPSVLNQQALHLQTRSINVNKFSSYLKQSWHPRLEHQSTEKEFSSLKTTSIDQTKSKRRNSFKISNNKSPSLKEPESSASTVLVMENSSMPLMITFMPSSAEAVSMSPTLAKQIDVDVEVETVTSKKFKTISSSFAIHSSQTQRNAIATPVLDMSQVEPKLYSSLATYGHTGKKTAKTKHSTTHSLKDIGGNETPSNTTEGRFRGLSVLDSTSNINIISKSGEVKNSFTTSYLERPMKSVSLSPRAKHSSQNEKSKASKKIDKHLSKVKTLNDTRSESFTGHRTTSEIVLSYSKDLSISSLLVNSFTLFPARASTAQTTFFASMGQPGDSNSAITRNYSTSLSDSGGSLTKGKIVQLSSIKKTLTTRLSSSISTINNDESSRVSITGVSSSKSLGLYQEFARSVSTSKYGSQHDKADELNTKARDLNINSTILAMISSRADHLNINKETATVSSISLFGPMSIMGLKTSIYSTINFKPLFKTLNTTRQVYLSLTPSSPTNPSYGSKTRLARRSSQTKLYLGPSETPSKLLKSHSQIKYHLVQSSSGSDQVFLSEKVMTHVSKYILASDTSSSICTTLCSKKEETTSKRLNASHISNISSKEKRTLSIFSSYEFRSLVIPSSLKAKSEITASKSNLVQSALATKQYSSLNKITLDTEASSRSQNTIQFSTGLLPSRSILENTSKLRSSESPHHSCQCKSYLFTNFSDNDLEKYNEDEKKFLSSFLNGTITGYFIVRWPYEGFLGKIGFVREGLVMQSDKSNLWWLHLKESEDKSHPVIKRIVSFQDINENITVKEREAFGSKTVRWYLEQWSSTVTIEASICGNERPH